jgi:hypothetical protein
MTQLRNAVEPFGEVNVYPGPNGGTRVVATILMEPRKEGAQTGIAIDGSGSMRKLFGQSAGGGVVSSIFAKEKPQNHISPVAQQLCAYLARNIDADNGTTCIYWAVGPNGTQVEVVGDLSADQAERHEFKGPSDFGTGTQLLPAVRYFVERFKDAPWGFYIFITDGELFDLEEVRQYSIRLAKDIAAGRRKPLKFVLIGLGQEANERQMEDLDDLETGTDVDLWDHKMAAEMKQLQEIFAEVVDRNARVADHGRILDPQGNVIRNYSDTGGLPALLQFIMPASADAFILEVNGQRIRQELFDPNSIPTVIPVEPAPVHQSAVQVVQPVAPAPPPAPPAPVAPVPTPPAEPKHPWDTDPIDLEMDDLAKSLDLEFSDLGPSQPQDIELKKADDEDEKK